MYRLNFFIFVASILVFSCKNSPIGGNNRIDVVKSLYEQASRNKDYYSAITYLNEVLMLDSNNNKNLYDSLAFYYIKKTQNFYSGKVFLEKALKTNPDNFRMLEFKSVFETAEGDFKSAEANLDKAYKLSNQKRHLYMKASLYVQQQNIEDYYKIVRSILDDKNYKSEKVEVAAGEGEEQLVDLKALCYSDLAQLALQANKDIKGARIYIDSSLKIEPNYMRALYFKEELSKYK